MKFMCPKNNLKINVGSGDMMKNAKLQNGV